MPALSVNRLLSALLLLCSLALSPWAQALEQQTFTKERFDQLQSQKALILINISATWCPTCRRQHEILETYQKQRPDSGIHILRVDFDDQKEWVTHFKAPRQSTLILYSGTEQVWFSVAETREAKIFAALESARAL